MKTEEKAHTYRTKACPVCGESSLVRLDDDKKKRWDSGEHVQNVWPEKTPDERELLITGTHPECWDKIFGDTEEDEHED